MAGRDNQVASILGSSTFVIPDEHGSVPAGTGIPSNSVQSSVGTDAGIDAPGVKQTTVNGNGNPRIVEPIAAAAAPSSSDPARRNRGAARSSGGNTRARARTTRPQTTENLEKLLFSVHLLLATKTEIEELAITPSAAHELAQAIADVNALSKKTSWISDETVAWFNLSIALGGTYIPMAIALYKKNKDADNETTPAPEILKPI